MIDPVELQVEVLEVLLPSAHVVVTLKMVHKESGILLHSEDHIVQGGDTIHWSGMKADENLDTYAGVQELI